MAAAGLLALLGLHAAVSISVHDGLLIPFLAQGSMKLAAFITLTSLIVVLFQSEESRQPPFPATAAVFVAASVFLVILQLLLQRGHIGSFIPLTNLLSGLVGILFLLAVSAYQDGRNTSRLLAGLAAIVALSISILFQNKGFILVAICFLIVVAFAWRGTRLERYTYGWRLAGALLVVFAVASAVVAAMQQLDLMPVSTDTIGRSLSIRGTLWSHAITVGSAAFPLRIGAGQFAATAGSIPILGFRGPRSCAHHRAHMVCRTWASGSVASNRDGRPCLAGSDKLAWLAPPDVCNLSRRTVHPARRPWCSHGYADPGARDCQRYLSRRAHRATNTMIGR